MEERFSHTADQEARLSAENNAEFQDESLAFLNKDREYFQYNSRDLVYLISPLMSQLQTSLRKFGVSYIGPLVIYKIIITYGHRTSHLTYGQQHCQNSIGTEES